MNRKALKLLAAVVILVVASVGYDEWVVVRHTDRSRMARLVVSAPPAGFTKRASASNAVTATDSPFAAVKAAAKAHPSATGAWTSSWTSPSSSSDSATLLVSLLPTPTVARTVNGQAAAQFLGPNSFKSQSYTLAGPVAVTGVPGARGAVFRPSSGASTAPVATAVYSWGRVQVLVIVGLTGTTTRAGAAAASLAAAEYAHLEKALPGFGLKATEIPPVATVIYWAVVGSLMVLAIGIPVAVSRTRRRHEQARARLSARQHQTRGSKIARRQAGRRR